MRNTTFFGDRTALGAIAFAMISSCGGANTASDANFRDVLDAHLAENPSCFEYVSSGDPREYFQRIAEKNSDIPDAIFLDALVQEGYLTVEKTTMTSLSTSSGRPREVKWPAKGYAATEKGKRFFINDGDRRKYCYATRRVVEISNFTKPADIRGFKASKVSFSTELADIAAWTKLSSANGALQNLDQELGRTEPQETSADLVLTDDGWVHYSKVR